MTAKMIDLTPTWKEILPTMLVVQRDATSEGVERIRPEFERMAALADHANVLRAKLKQLLDDTPGFDRDQEVSGADLLDWFAEYRAEVKALLSAPVV